MSVLLFLVCAAIFFILTTPLHRRKKAIAAFDPGEPPRRPVVQTKPKEAEQGQVELGDGVYWSPLSHPNPHVLIVGGSGSGKSWTIRLLAKELSDLGFHCVLFDFHGDLAIRSTMTYRVALDSEFGVNPPLPSHSTPRVEVRIRSVLRCWINCETLLSPWVPYSWPYWMSA